MPICQCAVNVLMRLWICTVLSVYFASCTKSEPPDQILAAKRALEFAQSALLRQNMQDAYAQLSDNAKRYLSVEQMNSALSAYHPKGYPTKVKAKQYELIPSQNNAVYIFIVGENSTERFAYRFMMERKATSDYRVALFERDEHYSESPLRKSFPIPIAP